MSVDRSQMVWHGQRDAFLTPTRQSPISFSFLNTGHFLIRHVWVSNACRLILKSVLLCVVQEALAGP